MLQWKGMDTNCAITKDAIGNVVAWFRKRGSRRVTNDEIKDDLFTSLGKKSNPTNASGLVTWVHASGFADKSGNTSALLNLLMRDEIGINEYALIYLSKLGIYDGKKAVNSQLVQICKYLVEEKFPELDGETIKKISRYSDEKLKKQQRDFGISRGDLLLNALNTTGLFRPSYLKKRKKGVDAEELSKLEILPEAKPVIDYISKYGSEMTLPPQYIGTQQGDTQYRFFGDLEHGIFEIIEKHPIPDGMREFFPNMISSHIIPEQKIYFGAPGTGKSYKFDDPNGKYKLKELPIGRVFRTTFHPDYDYAQFVGCYKPVSKDENPLSNSDSLDDLLRQLKDCQDAKYQGMTKARFFYSVIRNLGFIKAQGMSGKTLKDELQKAGFTGCPYDGEINELLKAYGWLAEDFDLYDGSITYQFSPQFFAKAYASSWSRCSINGGKFVAGEPVYVVIEEINRGNCAQIFGDIFQLLDRDEKGFSRYITDADADFSSYIEREMRKAQKWDMYKSIVGEGKLRLPPNFNILATMNTSDQSLFPMDSAFKRRFDWEYVPINYDEYKKEADGKEDKNSPTEWNFEIEVGNKKIEWLRFLKRVNANIYHVTQSEDKQMGEFFIKPKDGSKVIGWKDFRSKVLFYLWDSVYKDMAEDDDAKVVFHYKSSVEKHENQRVTFQSFFNSNEKIVQDLILEVCKNLNAKEYDDFDLGEKILE